MRYPNHVGNGHGVGRLEANRCADGWRIFTSFVLELVVYPAIHEIWKWHFEMKRAYAEPPPGALPSPDEAARGRTYKALHEQAMGGPHAEQVNPELVSGSTARLSIT